MHLVNKSKSDRMYKKSITVRSEIVRICEFNFSLANWSIVKSFEVIWTWRQGVSTFKGRHSIISADFKEPDVV